MRQGGLAALLFGAAGCIQTVNTQLDVGPGDLVILVSVDGDGRIQEVKSAMGGGPLPELGLGDGEVAFATVLRRSLLVGPSGAPLDDEVRRSLVVGIGPYPASGCGRCLFSSPYAPMIIHGGSTCPVPGFAAWAPLDTLTSGTFTERPWISAPGQCACADEPIPERPSEVDYQLLDPPGFFAPQAVAVAADGTVGLFSETRSLIVRPNGARVEADRLFSGPVYTAAPAPDGSFWVASHELGGVAEARRDRIAALGTELVIIDGLATLALAPVHSRTLATNAYFFGKDIDLHAVFEVCGLVASDTRCNTLSIEAFNESGEQLKDAAVLADGAFVVLNRQGMIVFERRIDISDDAQLVQSAIDRGSARVAVGAEVRFRSHSTNLAAVGLGAAELRQLAPIAGGAIACASNGAASWLIRIEVDRTAASDGPAPVLTVLGRRDGRCTGAGPSPDDPTKVRISLERGIYEVDARGVISSYDDPALPPIDHYQGVSPSVAVGRLGEVYLAAAGGPYRPIHVAAGIGGPVVAVLGRPDDLLVVEQHRVRRFVADHFELHTPVFAPTISAATLDPSGGIWIASGRRLYFVEPSGGPPIERAVLTGSSTIAGLEYLAPGRFLAFAADERPFLITDLDARPFTIVSDDPTTEATEVTPSCGIAEAMSARDGVGWYVGCQAQLYRAHPFADPPVLERIGFERATQLQYNFALGEPPPKLTAVAAVCPDRVYVGANGKGVDEAERGRLWFLAPELELKERAPGVAPLALNGLSLRDLPQSGGVTELDSDAPIALIPGPSRLDLLFQNIQDGDGSIHAFGDRVRTRFADPPSAGGGNGRDLLVGTVEGRVYRQVPAAGR